MHGRCQTERRRIFANAWFTSTLFFIAIDACRVDNQVMELNGFVRNGVIVLSGGASLPEGTPVTVSCGAEATLPSSTATRKRVVFPLVDSDNPGCLFLTNAMIGEIFDEEEASASQR
jgi:hypothetical protein